MEEIDGFFRQCLSWQNCMRGSIVRDPQGCGGILGRNLLRICSAWFREFMDELADSSARS